VKADTQDSGVSFMEKSAPKKFLKGDFMPLTKRKLTKETCEKFGYFISELGGTPCQVAPYYRNRKLVAQHIRFPNKEFPWIGSNNKVELFGQHLWPSKGKQLIITEGEIDCMSIAQTLGMKWPVVSIPYGAEGAKKAIQQNLEFVNGYDTIILAFDNDKPGKKATEAVAELIEPGRVKVFAYPPGMKDANDILKACKAKLIVQGIWNATDYRPDGIIEGSVLRDEVLSDVDVGYETPYPVLNKMLKGIRKGELYMLTAGSGIGKSTLAREILYHFLTVHKLRIGVVALEENKRKTVKAFTGLHLNYPLSISKPEHISNTQILKAFDETVGSGRFFIYDHWGSLRLDNLLSKLRYLAVGLKVDFILLDHVSIVVSGLDEMGTDERKLIDKLMTRLRSLIEETGVGVVAIVHLKRPTDNSSKGYNEGKAVSLTALRGSASLEQLSDVVIALERNQQGENSNESTIRVLKNRPIGITGIADTLIYNPDTGRLLTSEAARFKSLYSKEKGGDDENSDF